MYSPSGKNRLSFVIGTLAVIVVSIGAIAIIVSKVTPSTQPGLSPSEQPSVSTASETIIPFADCGAVQFGAPLPPHNPPTDIHVYPAAPPMEIDTSKLYQVTIVTAQGTIVLCLQPDLAPHTVNNFVVLAENGFYNGLVFHRVVANFVIQGGDPLGNGQGGPGYQFNDEPVHQKYVIGAVAMANSGPNTNGSQFFICTGSQCASLPPQYNLFGKVESGLSVAQGITQGTVMNKVTVSEQK